LIFKKTENKKKGENLSNVCFADLQEPFLVQGRNPNPLPEDDNETDVLSPSTPHDASHDAQWHGLHIENTSGQIDNAAIKKEK